MNLSAFVGEEWDDTELIRAYDKAVKSWRKSKTEEERNKETAGPGPWTSTESGGDMPPELKTQSLMVGSWLVGSPCRAVWKNDGFEYEAKVVNIEGPRCTIRFVGYGNQESKDLIELKETFGKRSRDRQRREAQTSNFATQETLSVEGGYLSSVSLTSSMYNNCPSVLNGPDDDPQTTDFSVPGTQRDSVSSSSAILNLTHSKSAGKRKRDENVLISDAMSIDGVDGVPEVAQLEIDERSEVLPSGAEATMGSSTSSDISEAEDGDDEATSGGAFGDRLKAAGGLSGFQGFSGMMPKFPVPPMPMSLANEQGKFDFGRGQLPSLLLSWYMSGYHSGYFDAQNEKSGASAASSSKNSRGMKEETKPRNKRQ